MLERVTNTTPLREENIGAGRPHKTVVLTDTTETPVATVGDLVAARNAKSLAAVNPKPNWLSGCFTRGASETTKMIRALVYSAYHPSANDLPDVLTFVEAVRGKLHADDRGKLAYIDDEYDGLHIAFMGIEETPITLYAEPREAAKRATEGIRQAGALVLGEHELAQLYLAGNMTKDRIFKDASLAQKALLGQLVAASTYTALDNALHTHESTILMLMPMTQAPTDFEEHKEPDLQHGGVGGMQATQPMPGVMPRVVKFELRQEMNGLIHADVGYEGPHHIEARFVVSDAHIHCVGLNAVMLPRDVSSEEMFQKRTFNDFA